MRARYPSPSTARRDVSRDGAPNLWVRPAPPPTTSSVRPSPVSGADAHTRRVVVGRSGVVGVRVVAGVDLGGHLGVGLGRSGLVGIVAVGRGLGGGVGGLGCLLYTS